ncbi:MAG: adenylate kinase [Candidatus Caenarcaniphilales bacterium]|nr:adenylate kinase [Candidatus Caenarcaniphilales bacterium]
MTPKSPNILLLGAPGVGKGTQAKLIEAELNYARLDTGSLIRSAIAQKTELGLKAEAYVKEGMLVPDELIIGFVLAELLRLKETGKPFLLDGFPRNLAQAEALNRMLEEQSLSLDWVLEIEVDTGKLTDRIIGRRLCSDKACGTVYHLKYSPPKQEGVCDRCGSLLFQRDDDKSDVVSKRLDSYKHETMPLIDYYLKQAKLQKIDGDQSPQEVFAEIRDKLSSL